MPLPTEGKTPFITFYSFKGGVGRSMALINVAGILAGRGFRVLAMDLDLEAPGISYLTHQSEMGPRPGFIDAVANVLEHGERAELVARSPAEVVEKYSFLFEIPEELRKSDEGSLRIMPAGILDGSYSTRLEQLELGELYRAGHGRPIVEAFKLTLQESALFDVVLVDSRTGFSEEAGICTRDLADHVVVVMGLNRQNVQGTATFLRALKDDSEQRKDIRIVLSPVPNGEDDLVDERERAATKALQDAWGEQLPFVSRIPYHPRLALTEEPHIFRRSRGYLYDAYVELEGAITKMIGFDPQSIRRMISEAAGAKNVERVLHGLKQLVKLDSSPTHILYDEKVRDLLLDSSNSAFRATMAKSIPVDDDFGFLSIALALSRERMLDAELFYRRLVNERPNTPLLFGSYALFLKDIREDYERADRMFERAIEADPNNANDLGNYALLLQNIREDYDRAQRMFERAIEADPNHANHLGNYALFLEDFRKDYDCAQQMFERAIEAAPSYANNLGNYAVFLKNIREDYDRAQRMFERAIEADPNHSNNLGNYTNFLFVRGKTREAHARLESAFAQNPAAPDLCCELYFYAYSHDRNNYPDALSNLKHLLEQGERSKGWPLEHNVRVVRESGDPHADFIAALAEVVSDNADLETLSGFPEWQDAQP